MTKKVRTPYPKANFTDEELDELRSCVIAVIEEGFTTPPYRDVVYDIIEKLNITQRVVRQYDISRPSSTTTNCPSWCFGDVDEYNICDKTCLEAKECKEKIQSSPTTARKKE